MKVECMKRQKRLNWEEEVEMKASKKRNERKSNKRNFKELID